MPVDMEHIQKAIREDLQKNRQYVKTMEDFSQVKTNEKRVHFVLSLPAVQKHIRLEEYDNSKNSEEACQLRTQGNQFFQKKNYVKSLKLYTASVLKAPVTNMNCFDQSNSNTESNDLELANAFANRSAVLFHLDNYDACLQNAELAFRCGYPKVNHYKLHERQGKCHRKLNNFTKAKQSFESAVRSLEFSTLDEKKREHFTQNLQSLIKEVKSVDYDVDLEKELEDGSRKSIHCHLDVPQIDKRARNPVFMSASSKVALRESAEMGRGLMASTDIKVGEIIAVEKPFASVNLSEREQEYCSHCSTRVECPVPCQQCCDVAFCSLQCQEEAWSDYHRIECKIIRHVQSMKSKLGHLALRMVMKAGFSYLMQERSNFCSGDVSEVLGYNKDGCYDSEDYYALYTLVNHGDKRTPEDLFNKAVQTVYLLKCLELTPFFKNCPSEQEEDARCYVGGHILRQIQMLPCNAHEISEIHWKPGDPTVTNTVEVGSGAYALLSLINHSCDPSVVRHNYGNVCVVRAIKPIQKGEEILDNYGAIYPLTTRAERRSKLRPQYYFDCNCDACQLDLPLYFDIPDDTPVFKCEECSGPVFILPNKHLSDSECSSCHRKQDLTQTVKELQESTNQYHVALEQVLAGIDMTVALTMLLNHLEFLTTHISLPWRDINNCQEAIKQCFATQANSYILP
ncbi:SET and MYND domain-containing protein 4-like [Saccostrea echinata]|uniref:SET and MYND domain-containing protein 4-like n=1 Tax=Saccostrea echinata TaxID=191078 RepID=UPI002A8261A3|nr:SET and MYND domain-containing protein 4-like [Saccostrea echinata]